MRFPAPLRGVVERESMPGKASESEARGVWPSPGIGIWSGNMASSSKVFGGGNLLDGNFRGNPLKQASFAKVF